MSTRSSASRHALILALAGAAAAPVLGDDDGAKRRDRLPAVEAQPITGRPVRADEWKLADAALDAGGGVAGGFDAKNVTLLSWLPLNALPGGSTTAADCWGYTSPSGREYAIIGIERGTAFVEVTDPVNPVIVGYVGGHASLWHDVTVIGDYAYACSDASGPGVQIIDLRQIDQGVVTHVKDWSPNGLKTIHTLISNPDSKTLYACGSNLLNGGLVAIDASDPENLALRSAWTTQYVHEAQVVTFTEGPYAGREIAFCFAGGPYYGYSKGFAIVDVTDKFNFQELSLVGYKDIQFCHQGWLSADGRYVYIDDELDGGGNLPYPLTRVMDVTDLTKPFLAATFTTPGNTAIDHNQYVVGSRVYQSNYTSGLRVFDATDPLKPFEFAHFDTFPEHNDPHYQGNWGNYPFFKSGTVILSDMQRGMFVVKVDCRADLDHDGVPTFFDFLAFQNIFADGSKDADLNGDGVLDLFDFLKFQNLFAEGCP